MIKGTLGAATAPAVWIVGSGIRQPSDVRGVERFIGQLCDSGLQILDGVVIVSTVSGPRHIRPLENLPRTAALPTAAWIALCTGHSLERAGVDLDPGLIRKWLNVREQNDETVFVVAFCVDDGHPAPSPLSRLATAPISWSSYRQLRRIHLTS